MSVQTCKTVQLYKASLIRKRDYLEYSISYGLRNHIKWMYVSSVQFFSLISLMSLFVLNWSCSKIFKSFFFSILFRFQDMNDNSAVFYQVQPQMFLFISAWLLNMLRQHLYKIISNRSEVKMVARHFSGLTTYTYKLVGQKCSRNHLIHSHIFSQLGKSMIWILAVLVCKTYSHFEFTSNITDLRYR